MGSAKLRYLCKDSSSSALAAHADPRRHAPTRCHFRQTASGVRVTGPAILTTPELRPLLPRSPQSVTVEIGDIPILLQPNDPKFCNVLEDRYAGFLNPDSRPACQFEIQL